MRATWYRANGALKDQDARERTVSVFYDYDLMSWMFGVKFEPDDCWYDLSFELGPLRISFCYWRPARLMTTQRGS